MSHSIAMIDSTAHTSKNSTFAIYATMAIVVKLIEVLVGTICLGMAAYDIIANCLNLAARSAAVITGNQLSWGLHAVQSVLKPIANFDHVFVDQLTCRIVFLVVATIFTIISLVQLIWFRASVFTGSLESRIISGVICHSIGFVLHLLASLFLLGRINLLGNRFLDFYVMRIVAILGIVNAVLYLLSTILALWSFIGNKNCQSTSSFEMHPASFMHSAPK